MSLLKYCSPLNEHYYLDLELTIPAAVYESEPSSIIACALSSNKYKNELKKIKQTPATAYPTGKISQQAVLSNESPNSAEISGTYVRIIKMVINNYVRTYNDSQTL